VKAPSTRAHSDCACQAECIQPIARFCYDMCDDDCESDVLARSICRHACRNAHCAELTGSCTQHDDKENAYTACCTACGNCKTEVDCER